MFVMYFDQNGKGDPIAKYWNEGTREAYIRDYEKRLLPHLPIEKSLEAYEEEDFTEALALVKKENPGYTDHTIDHYRYLIWRVYQAGLDNNLYDDKLFWGVTGQTGSHSASEIKQTQTRELTRKSLSIGEEMKLLDWFKALDPCAADGRLVGLAIMFFMADKRNGRPLGISGKEIGESGPEASHDTSRPRTEGERHKTDGHITQIQVSFRCRYLDDHGEDHHHGGQHGNDSNFPSITGLFHAVQSQQDPFPFAARQLGFGIGLQRNEPPPGETFLHLPVHFLPVDTQGFQRERQFILNRLGDKLFLGVLADIAHTAHQFPCHLCRAVFPHRLHQ